MSIRGAVAPKDLFPLPERMLQMEMNARVRERMRLLLLQVQNVARIRAFYCCEPRSVNLLGDSEDLAGTTNSEEQQTVEPPMQRQVPRGR